MADSWDFVVRRDDLRQSAVLDGTASDGSALADAEVLVKVDLVSLTANNVTYAALGDQLSYWRFYPAPEPWGRIPAWGYAEVTHSRADGVEPGMRLFGYWPLSSHAVLRPGPVHGATFFEVSDHRRDLATVYNTYRISKAGAARDREERVALFMPLYGTSWLLADWLSDESFFGATTLVASAASSKTALGLGHALQRDFDTPIRTVGLTSSRNRAFTEGTGHWDSVATYDELESLDVSEPAVYVDCSGNADLRLRMHTHFEQSLRASVAVGLADWESTTPDPDGPRLPGPRAQMFFAPARVAKRTEDWGADGLGKRLATSQDRFIDRSHEWLTIQRGSGAEEIRTDLLALMDGTVPPDVGLVVSL